jgi:hypothetical protein
MLRTSTPVQCRRRGRRSRSLTTRRCRPPLAVRSEVLGRDPPHRRRDSEEQRKAPLEREIEQIKQRYTRSGPVLDGLLTGRVAASDLAALQTNTGEQFALLMIRAFVAQDKAMNRLAQGIDAINTSGR